MLSDSKLKKLKKENREKNETFSDRDGLYVRATAGGKIVFFVRYRFDKKAKAMDIGEYPLLSLQDARAKTVNIKQQISDGIDPRLGKCSSMTTNEAYAMWYEKEGQNTIKRHGIVYARYKNHLSKKIGNTQITKVTTAALLDILDSIKVEKPETAKQLLSNMRVMFAFCVRRQIIEINPLQNITAAKDLIIESKIDDRYLNDKEIVNFWVGTNQHSRLFRAYALMSRLVLIFGCRPSELLLARKDHFDFKEMIWTVPTENHKTGKKSKKPIIRPIPKKAKKILKELIKLSKGDHLVNGKSRDIKDRSNQIWSNWPQVINNNADKPIKKWSIYSLRKTMRTGISQYTEPHIAEMLVGHAMPVMWRTYDHGLYLEEKLKAYDGWIDHLERLLKENSLNLYC